MSNESKPISNVNKRDELRQSTLDWLATMADAVKVRRMAEKAASMVADEPKRSADDIIAMYALSTGLDPKEEFDSAAKDLITDILHSLRSHDLDQDIILSSAQRAFEEEVNEEKSAQSKGETRD